MRALMVMSLVALTGCVAEEPVVINDLSVSDEQDFDAVSSRETIESDAERLAENRENYVVFDPSDVPQRPDGLGPNIVAYALQTTNPRGVPLYTRRGILSEQRNIRNCARFSSPGLAQIEFLRRGGPEADPLVLDPDGDGFACGWDPEPFRAAARG